jgi:trehalose 6-phosphate synthase
MEGMRRGVRFAIVLVAGLAVLTWIALIIASRTARRWFERDVALRAELAINGSRRALVANWRDREWKELGALLVEITRDERIMGAAACGTDLRAIARTPEYPDRFRCSDIGPHVRAAASTPIWEWVTWRNVADLPGGKASLTAFPMADGERALGFVVLVHDLSFVERREEVLRRFLLAAFGVLAACAAIVTVAAARLSWRNWRNDILRFVRGEGHGPEFQPVLQDVRALVARLSEEREVETGGRWNPARLKQALARHFQGETVVIVANREPYIHELGPDGGVKVLHPASGLVTALEPVMRACSGVWVAHGSGSADRLAADPQGRVSVPPGEDSYTLKRVWLTPEEEKGYYYGFSNEGLWPLCHMAHARPVFRIEDWKHYQTVNRRFADALCAEVDSEDPVVLVQDYHFALLPALVRQRLPRATIITFWHIPWPHAEGFGICPWRDELLQGLLGSSIFGLQTQLHCNNFIDAVDRYLEARIDREQAAIVQGRRTTLVRPYPIAIEWPSRWSLAAPSVEECHNRVFEELGLPADAHLIVGVDRLDYTKGIEERLLAVERLLDKEPALRGRLVFAQLAAPSRTAIDRYRRLGDSVEELAARVNERYGQGAYRPVVLLRSHHEPPAVFRYYRAADACYVSSLHDGMNLVAKEFVAARDDERGVLVLSQFTGAARELTEALVVNPYDIEEASDALSSALRMPVWEQRDRMRAMRALLAEFNVYRWAGRMLVDAARLRRRDRLSGRLSEASLRRVESIRR